MRDLAFPIRHQNNVKYLWIGITNIMRTSFIFNLPGILLSIFIAFFAIYFSDYLGTEIFGFYKSPVSSIMLSVIIGMIIGNIFNFTQFFTLGFNFSVNKILKFGIICLGVRLSFTDILNYGLTALPIVLVCVASSLLIVKYLSEKINVSLKMATLIAVGTSICGTSAIVATAPIINANKEEVTYAITNITIFGIIAMLFYPFLANFIFSGSEYSAGLFIGTSIHETSQVVGAGLMYAEQYNASKALDIATVTKLVRNTCMLVIVPLMAFIYFKNHSGSQNINDFSIFKIFPIFILGFVAMSIIRTIGDITLESSGYGFYFLEASKWLAVVAFVKQIAVFSLGVAMASLGLSTDLKSLVRIGYKPFFVGFFAATSVSMVSFLTIKLIIA